MTAGRSPGRTPGDTTRLQRVLATMAATVFGLSALAIVVLFVTRAAGTPSSAYSHGILQVLGVLPTPGLALALGLVIALVVMNGMQRARANRR